MAFFLTTIGLKVKSPKVGDAARSSETRVSSNAPTQNQQQLNNSTHGPVSNDLLFSNWLLMCLAWNYCDSDKSVTSPVPSFSSGFASVTTNVTTIEHKKRESDA